MKKNTIGKRISTVALVTAMMLATAACGSSEKSSDDSRKESANNLFGAEATTTAAFYEEDYDYEDYEDESSVSGVTSSKQAMAAGATADYAENEAPTGSESGNTTTSLTKIDADKLVYRCNLSFETTEYDASIQRLQSLIRQYGGFLEYENVSENGPYGKDGRSLYSYNATIRIPSASYNDFINNTGDIGDLKNKNHNVENLSAEYTDLSAQLEVLETKHASYLEMMKEAKKLDDMESLLMVDDRITQVEIEINRIKSRMNSINNDVAYSYITVLIDEVKEYEEAPAESFGDRVSRGLRDGWEDFVEGLKDFVVNVSENLPRIIIAIVIIVLCYIFIIRKLLRLAGVPTRKERKARREAKKAANAETEKTADVQAPQNETVQPEPAEEKAENK